jgi:predicted Zn-dependent protease
LKTAIVLLIAIILGIFVFYFTKHWQPAIVEEKGYEEAAGSVYQQILGYSEKTDSSRREEKFRLLEKMNNLEPVTSKDCYRLGVLYLEDKKYKEAKVPLEIAAKNIPDNISVWRALYLDYRGLGESKKAENAEKKVRTLAKRLD